MSTPSDSKAFTRRNFAAAITTAAALPALSAPQQPARPAGATDNQPDPNTSVMPGMRGGTIAVIQPFDAPLEFKRSDVPLAAEPFPMTQVRLLPSIFKDAQDWNRAYMQRLPEDRLVRNFMVNAGLPSSAQPLGGWEQDTAGRAGELRGHFTGHYLSAAAFLGASTGDAEIKAKGDQMVADLAKCQAKLGGGYLSAFPTEWFDRLDARKSVWAPFYTIHKIMAGMFDMYQVGGNKQALTVLEGMASWADQWTASKSEEHMQSILNTEYGGMGETLYNLAAVTGEDRWARAGDRFTKKSFFNPLAMSRDELRGLHSNTHIPQVLAAARRYEISGDARFQHVSDFFFETVSKNRTYATGGTSNGEGWLVQPGLLGHELKIYGAPECCCSYNMLKLARHLYSWSPEPSYFDYYEHTMLNMRIGTIHPQTGVTQYYLSLNPGAYKTFNTDYESFWCCTGSGVEEYSKLNDSIYWRDADGVYVNLFVASELNWAEKGFKLRQETKFPEQQSTSLVVAAAGPARMSIRLRVPSWLKSAPTVKLNGKPLEASAAPGSYLTISRVWKTADRIEMELPMHLTVEKMPDDPTIQAFLYGPLALAGDFGADGLTPNMLVGPNSPRARWPRPAGVANPNANANAGRGGAPLPPVDFNLKAAHSDPAAWIKPTGKPLTFQTTGQTRDVTLVPINSVFDRRYVVYWQVS